MSFDWIYYYYCYIYCDVWVDCDSNPMSVCDKNPTAFQGTRKREQRIGKSFKSFIYFLIGRNRFRTAVYILVNIDFNIPNTKVTVLTNTDVYAQKSKV